MRRLLVLTPPALLVFIELWVAQGEPWLARLASVAAALITAVVLLILLLYLIDHEERQTVLLAALPVVMALLVVTATSAVAVRILLSDATPWSRFAVLYVFSFLGTLALSALFALLLLAFSWKN